MLAVLQFDSPSLAVLDRMLDAGRLPALAGLRERGWWSEVVPTMPPTTPTGWATVATGAWPGTHGIEGFQAHRPGQPLDRPVYVCASDCVRGELLWEAAARAGRRSVLLKFPMSWPPRGGELVTQVDGAGGWAGIKCVWDLAHSACWDTEAPARPAAAPSPWLARDQDNLDEEAVGPLAVRPAGAAPPQGVEPLWETEVPLGAGLPVLVGRAAGRDVAVVGGQPVREGEWSGWLRVAERAGTDAGIGHVRFKVMALDAGAGRLRLYQSQVHREAGFTTPDGLAAELQHVAGPFAEWTESYDRLQGWIDDATQLELYEQHVDWMSRAARHLLATRECDLFLSQIHFVDMAYHLYWGAIDARHSDHDPERAAGYWALLGRVHELADRFVAEVQAELSDEDLLVVVGDHGHDCYHTAFLVNHHLARAGLLGLGRDRRTGHAAIDWSRTLAYADSYRVHLNVAGRDPAGVVAEADREAVARRVVRVLESAIDPRTGEPPVRIAMRGADAESLGLRGPGAGDVVFASASGYQARSTIAAPAGAWAAGGRLLADRLPVFQPTRLFRQFTGEHDTSWPLAGEMRTLLAMGGGGTRARRRPMPVRLVDVAPTMCDFLGIPWPAACEGQSLWREAAGG